MSTLKVNGILAVSGTADAISLTASDKTCTANITNNLSNRNLIINGSMQIAQRGTSSTSNGYQTVDRFCHYSGGGTTTWSVGTETSGTVWGLGLRKYLRCTNTANATAAGNYREITYKIENRDLMDSGWNVASTSSKITLSFWVRASVAQVYYGRIRWMGDSADSNYVFSTGSLTADTWTKVTKTIPGKSGKTVNDGGSQPDNTSLFQLNWSPFQGTDGTASGTALDQWNTYAGASKYPDFVTTWGSTNGATFDITGIQLEIGDSAGDFENRTYAEELVRCQRYYYKTLANNNEFFPGMGMADTDGNTVILNTQFPVRMRSAPSALEQSGTASDYKIRRSTTQTCSSVPTFGHATLDQVSTQFTKSSHGWGDGSSVRCWSGATDAYLGWSAEF